MLLDLKKVLLQNRKTETFFYTVVLFHQAAGNVYYFCSTEKSFINTNRTYVIITKRDPLPTNYNLTSSSNFK